MKYFTGGAILFVFYIASLEIIPRFVPSFTREPIPLWWIVGQIIIAGLFFFLGTKTIRIEKKTLAGAAFILLGIVTLLIMSVFIGLSGLKG
jgi:hypothetical protein